jgi:hypothetical protein
VQHELRRGLLVEASYAGSHGTHIMGYSYDLNQLDPQYYGLGLALEDRVPNPFFGIIPPGTPLSAATIARRQALRPFPAYLNVTVTNPPLGRTKYNSAQLKVERRFSQGIGFLTSYTLARLTGDVGRNLIDFGTIGGAPQSAVMCSQNAKFDRQSCYSIEPQDITHQFVASGLYDLPFGTGRRYLSSGVLGAIVGGFRVNAILSLRSGLPLVIRGANNGGFADRPNLVGDPAGEKTLARWFNTSAFAAAAPFSIGSTPRALDNPRGPGFASVDFALVREIGLGQPRTLQLRAEAFNLFNRVNFNQPNVNFLSGEFGQVTSAGEGRRVQLGVKLYF